MKLLASRLATLVLLIAASVVSVEAGISARGIMNGHYREAASFAPWSTRAHEREATSELMRLDGSAAVAAQQAIRLSPINASAIRTLGLLRLEEGDAYAGNRLMEAAAGLGWRDPLTQFWSIEAAERTSEPVKAAQRAEALFRQGIYLRPCSCSCRRKIPIKYRGCLLECWRSARRGAGSYSIVLVACLVQPQHASN